jgi:hypothetical protein
MEHIDHRPGTEKNCANCQEIAYEPSWYAALAAFVEDGMTVLSTEGASVRA